jgi:hypothetical protein
MERVGWVERSETHHLVEQEAILMGFVSLNPSYSHNQLRRSTAFGGRNIAEFVLHACQRWRYLCGRVDFNS